MQVSVMLTPTECELIDAYAPSATRYWSADPSCATIERIHDKWVFTVDNVQYRLGRVAMRRGVAMAIATRRDAWKHREPSNLDSWDMATFDVAIQYALFGELRFG